jgi:hypothetical protein
VYGIGFKVLSMKINYLASFKHEHICIRSLSMEIIYPTFVIAWYRCGVDFHENKLPCICSVYGIGFKVLSMKINYLASFKHEHKHERHVHGN